MAERATVFLFMDPEALQELGLRPCDPRRAHVDRVALRLGKRATLVPHPEGRVYGVLMTLMHSEIDHLYSEARGGGGGGEGGGEGCCSLST